MDPITPGRVGPDRPPPPRSLVDRARDWVTWFGVGRLLASALSLAAIAGAAFWLLRSPPPPVESTLPFATTIPPAVTTSSAPPDPSTTSTPPSELVVHVAGAVVVPGVRTLPPGARVVDAVSAAGGLTPEAASDALNLAAALHDGDRIYVPTLAEATAVPVGVTPAPASGPGGEGTGSTPHAPVDVNTASAAELEALPGVGPATAAAIVAHRDERGPFLSVDQLGDVAGIGRAKLAALRDLVTT
jgi:competence protein ComEA